MGRTETLWELLYRRRRLVVACLGSAILVGALYFFAAPRWYRTTALLQVAPGELEVVLGGRGGGLPLHAFTLQQQAYLGARSTRRAAIERMSVDAGFGLADRERLDRLLEKHLQVRSRVESERGVESGVIRLELDFPGRGGSRFLDSLVEVFRERREKALVEESEEVTTRLRKRRAELDSELGKILDELYAPVPLQHEDVPEDAAPSSQRPVVRSDQLLANSEWIRRETALIEQRLQALDQAASTSPLRIVLIDPPWTDPDPVAPRLLPTAIVSLAIGAIIAVLAAMAAEWRRPAAVASSQRHGIMSARL